MIFIKSDDVTDEMMEEIKTHLDVSEMFKIETDLICEGSFTEYCILDNPPSLTKNMIYFKFADGTLGYALFQNITPNILDCPRVLYIPDYVEVELMSLTLKTKEPFEVFVRDFGSSNKGEE